MQIGCPAAAVDTALSIIRGRLEQTFKIISKADRNQGVYSGVIRSERMQNGK
jgi:hypothetical protein